MVFSGRSTKRSSSKKKSSGLHGIRGGGTASTSKPGGISGGQTGGGAFTGSGGSGGKAFPTFKPSTARQIAVASQTRITAPTPAQQIQKAPSQFQTTSKQQLGLIAPQFRTDQITRVPRRVPTISEIAAETQRTKPRPGELTTDIPKTFSQKLNRQRQKAIQQYETGITATERIKGAATSAGIAALQVPIGITTFIKGRLDKPLTQKQLFSAVAAAPLIPALAYKVAQTTAKEAVRDPFGTAAEIATFSAIGRGLQTAKVVGTIDTGIGFVNQQTGKFATAVKGTVIEQKLFSRQIKITPFEAKEIGRITQTEQAAIFGGKRTLSINDKISSSITRGISTEQKAVTLVKPDKGDKLIQFTERFKQGKRSITRTRTGIEKPGFKLEETFRKVGVQEEIFKIGDTRISRSIGLGQKVKDVFKLKPGRSLTQRLRGKRQTFEQVTETGKTGSLITTSLQQGAVSQAIGIVKAQQKFTQTPGLLPKVSLQKPFPIRQRQTIKQDVVSVPKQKVSFKTKLGSITSVKPATDTRTRTAISKRQEIRPLQIPALSIKPGQRTKPVTKPVSDVGQIPAQKPFSKPLLKPIKTPFFNTGVGFGGFTGFALPIIPGGGFGGGFLGGGKKFSPKFKYSPSLKGVAFGVKKKKRKFLTGLEIRGV